MKAESYITCTSSNAVAVVESLGVDRVIFTPDQYLGKWVATQTEVEVILWEGSCMVHERFTGDEISDYKRSMGEIPVIAHPECPPDVLDVADYVGSTYGMIQCVQANQPSKVMMITECSMADQCGRQHPRYRVHPPVQSVPSHEADHSRQHSHLARDDGLIGLRSPPKSRRGHAGLLKGCL